MCSYILHIILIFNTLYLKKFFQKKWIKIQFHFRRGQPSSPFFHKVSRKTTKWHFVISDRMRAVFSSPPPDVLFSDEFWQDKQESECFHSPVFRSHCERIPSKKCAPAPSFSRISCQITLHFYIKKGYIQKKISMKHPIPPRSQRKNKETGISWSSDADDFFLFSATLWSKSPFKKFRIELFKGVFL